MQDAAQAGLDGLDEVLEPVVLHAAPSCCYGISHMVGMPPRG